MNGEPSTGVKTPLGVGTHFGVRPEMFGVAADMLVKHSPCPVLTVTISGDEIKESKDPKICSEGEIRL